MQIIIIRISILKIISQIIWSKEMNKIEIRNRIILMNINLNQDKIIMIISAKNKNYLEKNLKLKK